MKHLPTLLLLLAPVLAQAQITDASIVKPGTIAVTGGVGYTSTTTKVTNGSSSNDYNVSQFYITPGIGYFVANNTPVGISLSYSVGSSPNAATTTVTGPVRPALDGSKVLRLGGFVGHTKMFTDNFGIFGTLNGGYQNVRSQDYSATNPILTADTKGSGYYAALTPGISYWPVRAFSVSATMGSLDFSRINYDYPTNSGTEPSNYSNHTNDFGARFGLNQFVLSATYFIGRPD